MAVEVIGKKNPVTIFASRMVVGAIGICRSTNNEGEIVLRTFHGLVSLTNPQHTWDGFEDSGNCGENRPTGPQVELLPIGTSIQYTSETFE